MPIETPDTLNYLYLGLGVVFGILGLYLVSVWARFRNHLKTLHTLEQLEQE